MNVSRVNALLLVFVTVLLGLVGAYCLKEASVLEAPSFSLLLAIIMIVAGVNGVRFVLWGYIHKKYPLSISYPFNSVFYPLVLLMGYFYGDPVTFAKVVGVLLITAGVAVMAYEGSD